MPVGEVGHVGHEVADAGARATGTTRSTTFRTRLNGYYLTGDLMYRDDDGYYYHVDRASDAVDLGDGQLALHRAVRGAHPRRAARTCATAPWSPSGADDGTVVTDVLLLLAAGADPARRPRPSRSAPRSARPVGGDAAAGGDGRPTTTS